MQAVIVDYGSGNLRSAAKAFERAGAEVRVTADADEVRRAERIVLPGVGAFADCMRGLEAVPGMREALEEAVRRRGKPFLGICVGMQLMAERGREFETVEGLNWIEGEIVAMQPHDKRLKIPHMGWNELSVGREHPLTQDLAANAHAYFVHSYHLAGGRADELVATTDYGGAVTAIVARDNIAGTQFHPEKSQETGLALIANFLKWRP
jgi:glutamine amidotransferase